MTLLEELVVKTREALEQGVVSASIVQAVKYIEERQGSSRRVMEYKRPDWLATKQHYIIDAMQARDVFVEGSRQTGKSTAIFLGIIEMCLAHEGSMWHIIASNEDNCVALHQKLVSELWDEIKGVVAYTAAKKTQLLNGSVITAHSTRAAQVKGLTGNIWCDETDMLLRSEEGKECVAAAAACSLASPDFRLCYSANQGGQEYAFLKRQLAHLFDTGRIAFFTLNRDDVPHITEESSEVVAAIMAAVKGEAYMRAQLLNEEIREGCAFDGTALTRAFEMYDDFLDSGPPHPDSIAIGIDPGQGHATGICVVAYSKHYDVAWVLEAEERNFGNVNDLIFYVTSLKQKYCSAEIVVESNTGGIWIANQLRDLGHRAFNQNFAGPTSIWARGNFVNLFSHFLQAQKIYLSGGVLEAELRYYDLAKKNTESKGDLADATLHALWRATDGSNYLALLRNARRGRVVWA